MLAMREILKHKLSLLLSDHQYLTYKVCDFMYSQLIALLMLIHNFGSMMA